MDALWHGPTLHYATTTLPESALSYLRRPSVDHDSPSRSQTRCSLPLTSPPSRSDLRRLSLFRGHQFDDSSHCHRSLVDNCRHALISIKPGVDLEQCILQRRLHDRYHPVPKPRDGFRSRIQQRDRAPEPCDDPAEGRINGDHLDQRRGQLRQVSNHSLCR